jgi:hypothetical protein
MLKRRRATKSSGQSHLLSEGDESSEEFRDVPAGLRIGAVERAEAHLAHVLQLRRVRERRVVRKGL